MILRGLGMAVPLLFIGSLLPMISSHELGVRNCQTIGVSILVVSGVWAAAYGWKSLLDAAEILGRPLAWWEWVFDVALLTPRPFHSFLLIQLPWWSIAFGVAAYYWLRLMFEPSASS